MVWRIGVTGQENRMGLANYGLLPMFFAENKQRSRAC